MLKSEKKGNKSLKKMEQKNHKNRDILIISNFVDMILNFSSDLNNDCLEKYL